MSMSNDTDCAKYSYVYIWVTLYGSTFCMAILVSSNLSYSLNPNRPTPTNIRKIIDELNYSWFYSIVFWSCGFGQRTCLQPKLIFSHRRQVYPCKIFRFWFLIYDGAITDPGSISWLAVQWVESNVEFIPAYAGLDFRLSIYNPALLSTLALLSVSRGLPACSPSAASSFCVDQLLHSQQPRTMAQQQQIRYGLACLFLFKIYEFYNSVIVNSSGWPYVVSLELTWQIIEALGCVMPPAHMCMLFDLLCRQAIFGGPDSQRQLLYIPVLFQCWCLKYSKHTL